MYFYSKTTGGFYTHDINGDNIPSDAVEVLTDDYVSLLQGQSAGQIIVANANGYPVLTNPPEPTPEEKKERCKVEASRRLQETDYTQAQDVRAALSNVSEFDEYRATVRSLWLLPVPDPVFPDKPEAKWRAV